MESPEDITLCDPACGSGHILSYAFELLYAIYEECGYVSREIPELILTKNLSGYEIDPRAAQIASLVLALRAREHDRRFFSRDVRADVRVLESVSLEEGETGLPKKLAEELSHLGEIGSLLVPTDEDIDAIRAELASRAGDLFAAATKNDLERALEACEALRRRFDVVVANPPYMGSSSFNPFMSGWVKKNYPDVKSDLCTCFIERILSICKPSGFSGLATSNSWMFLSSFEKLRDKLIDDATIETLVQLSVHGFHGIAAQVCTFVLRNSVTPGFKGSYIRLNDFDHHSLQEPKTLEAIKNPTCGWFYCRDASTFHQIPGSPIAYWASDALLSAFEAGSDLRELVKMPYGFKTGDNASFLRLWWETPLTDNCFDCGSFEESKNSSKKWYAYNKGGQFRRWYGNNDHVLLFKNGGERVIGGAKEDNRNAADYTHELLFKPTVTWSRISSGKLAMRSYPSGSINDMTGPGFFSDEETLCLLQALCNSKIIELVSAAMSPTLDFQPGQVGSYPVLDTGKWRSPIIDRVMCNRSISKSDWDSLETSWDFKRSPLL